MLADELLRDPVELAGRDPELQALSEQRDRLGDELAGSRHAFDFLSALSDDHAAGTCSNADWISAKTWFSLRSPWIGTRLPRTR